ncbi:MAG: hypothetical protein AAFR58_04270 [Cyanobacteria bacterium J06627_28]
MAIVMPITSVQKPGIKTMIPIPEDAKVRGSVIAEQVRTVDLSYSVVENNTRGFRKALG